MVAGILGTDMQFHGDLVKRLTKVKLADELWEEHDLLVEVVMHTADVSNPFMPLDISAQWSERINVEFTHQVEMEKKLALPVTAMMDGLTDPKKAAKSLMGFLDFIIAPLARDIFRIFPQLEQPKQCLEGNRQVTAAKFNHLDVNVPAMASACAEKARASYRSCITEPSLLVCEKSTAETNSSPTESTRESRVLKAAKAGTREIPVTPAHPNGEGPKLLAAAGRTLQVATSKELDASSRKKSHDHEDPAPKKAPTPRAKAAMPPKTSLKTRPAEKGNSDETVGKDARIELTHQQSVKKSPAASPKKSAIPKKMSDRPPRK
jgi:hypothetical protein